MVSNLNSKIQRILKKLPSKPGVYKMIGKDGAVLYVGKAKDLKSRVASYFQESAKLSVRKTKMISRTHDLHYITVDSELEALILESNLIKELKPRYNVMLKDDKNFVYIKVFVQDDFPRIQIVRKVEKDGAKYYGPKTSAKKARKTLDVLKGLFPFRDCSLGIKLIQELGSSCKVEIANKTIKYPCLNYHINTCSAPCIGACTKQNYDWMIEQIQRFLEGKSDHLVNMLKNDMQIAVNERRFEDAAGVRDKIQSIESVLEKQKISEADDVNQDVVGFYMGISQVFVNLFIVRSGKLIDSENFILDVTDVAEEDLSEVFEGFLRDYYEKCSLKPDSVLLPFALEGESLLSEMTGVKIFSPKIGEKHKLVEMSNKNAEHYYKQMMVKWESDKAYDPLKALEVLGKELGVKKKIKRIEGYDISHFAGDFTVGAMVVLDKGEPKNSDYRHFKLRGVNGGDDYGALAEVLSRRLKYIFTSVQKGVIVRRGLKKDITEVDKIMKKENLFDKDVVMKDFVILEKGKKIIGMGRLLHHEDKDIISSLWVSPKMRGKGLGHVILQALIEKAKAKRVYIGCNMENAPFYEKFGFRHVKKAPDFMAKVMGHCKWNCNIASVFVYENKEDKAFKTVPELIVLDGGKGQLSKIAKVWKQFDAGIPLVAMDKSGKKLWHLKNGEVVDSGLKSDSQPFYLLQRVIDEAHRFSNRLREDLQLKHLTK